MSPAVRRPPIATKRPGPHARVTPNLFGISFGLAGLAETWSAATEYFQAPGSVADIMWVVAATVWIVTVFYYVTDLARRGERRTELHDPVFAPFVALLTIVPMLGSVALAEHTRTAGVVLFFCFLVATALLGGVLIAQWMVEDLTAVQLHPGYFLPTVAGGYLGAAACAALGYPSLAKIMFGWGTLSWLVLGSILLQRMFVQPRLPRPLLPTMAIQVAPPVVAGTAWFGINGGRVDTLALGLAGYAALMVLVQLRLFPVYRAVPFGPGWWAFAFSYAAIFIDGIHWLAAGHAAHGRIWSYTLLTVVSAAIGALVLRTGIALSRRTFLPAPPTPRNQEV